MTLIGHNDSAINVVAVIIINMHHLLIHLRILMHKAREHQQPLYMCFVDFKKAFDTISHNKLSVTMMDMGYPLHLIDLLAKTIQETAR